MIEVLAAVLILGGSLFMLVAAIGILRLPDFYTRMHAITKAGTLGVGLTLVGIAIFFGDLSATTRAMAVFAFVVFTAPVSAHMIGRAGYLYDVPLWKGTLVDQLQRRGGMFAQSEEERASGSDDASGQPPPS